MAKRVRHETSVEPVAPDDLDEQASNLLATVASLLARVQDLEDTNSIRYLHHAYGYYIDKCLYPSVVDLFSDSPQASVHFLNGVWKGKAGISRLYIEWFGTLFTGGRNAPPRGFLLDHLMMQDIITVNPETHPRTAKARFRNFMQGGFHSSVDPSERAPDVPPQFLEGGVYENEYIFENGVWKIFKLGYNMLWQADYAKGWSGSEAMKGMEKCWPEDKWGPDELLAGKTAWPETRVVPFHYMHPVSGARIGE
ncbi:hypothetical protein N431DRAFT_412472 [Stipitochalara longipes BDJ]|nr:hypothetical protein N431DRAFT_412472 [Stipitochalara longipes BDJ]